MARPRKPEGERLERASIALPGAVMVRLRQIAGQDYLDDRMGPSGRPSVSGVVREAVEDYLERKAKAS
jgi:hypothetical protein